MTCDTQQEWYYHGLLSSKEQHCTGSQQEEMHAWTVRVWVWTAHSVLALSCVEAELGRLSEPSSV